MATCHHHRTDKCHLQMDNLIQMVHNQTDSHIQTANSLINHILDNNIQWIHNHNHTLDNNIRTVHNHNHTLDNNIQTVHNLDSNIPIKNIRMPVLIGCIWIRKNVLLMAVHGVET